MKQKSNNITQSLNSLMQKLIIEGKKELRGKIFISVLKTPHYQFWLHPFYVIASLQNVPLVKDIFTMIELLEYIGLKIKISEKKIF